GRAPVTTSGTITFTSPDGVAAISLIDNDNGDRIDLNFLFTSGTITDATGSLTASYTFDAASGNGEIHYTYTLLDNVIGNIFVDSGNTTKSFAVAISDADFDLTPGGNLDIKIVDDAPVASPDLAHVGAFQTTSIT